MSKFSIEAPVRSCSVSKGTIERLERYIFDKAATINQLSLDQIREDYQIESIDSLGTETLRSIHEHGRFRNPARKFTADRWPWDFSSDILNHRPPDDYSNRHGEAFHLWHIQFDCERFSSHHHKRY